MGISSDQIVPNQTPSQVVHLPTGGEEQGAARGGGQGRGAGVEGRAGVEGWRAGQGLGSRSDRGETSASPGRRLAASDV